MSDLNGQEAKSARLRTNILVNGTTIGPDLSAGKYKTLTKVRLTREQGGILLTCEQGREFTPDANIVSISLK